MKTASAILSCAAIVITTLAMPTFVLAEPALGASASAAGKHETEIIGFISPMQGAGICMDGATHLIHSTVGDFRLKAANAQAAKDLASVANGKDRVALSGHRVTGPECVYFAVDRVTHTVHD